MILDTALDAIGHTPLVRIRAFESHHPGWQLLGKCEFLNAGGSIKDRVALRMIEDAERQGRIQPGDTLIEATSGNTGIGLALVGAIKGYNVIVTMPDRMSIDKTRVLEALGATVYRTDSNISSYDPLGYIGYAQHLAQSLPRAHILDQYANPSNTHAHFDTTGPEIAASLKGSDIHTLDMFVAGMGTGGTITGAGSYLRTIYPDISIIGVEPFRSVFDKKTHVTDLPQHPKHFVEGIGSDFVPDVYHSDTVTTCLKISDHDAFTTAQTLIQKDGLMVGGSCGAAVYGALQSIKKQPPSHHLRTCVVILPDGAMNYLSTFLNPHWLAEKRAQWNQQTTRHVA